MKNCTHCKHAVWDRTAKGKLMASGKGRCDWQLPFPKIPPAFFCVSLAVCSEDQLAGNATLVSIACIG
jgi:hypothetical protein